MQKIFYEDSPYAIMWYDPLFAAWRTDRFTGYKPQPAARTATRSRAGAASARCGSRSDPVGPRRPGAATETRGHPAGGLGGIAVAVSS